MKANGPEDAPLGFRVTVEPTAHNVWKVTGRWRESRRLLVGYLACTATEHVPDLDMVPQVIGVMIEEAQGY